MTGLQEDVADDPANLSGNTSDYKHLDLLFAEGAPSGCPYTSKFTPPWSLNKVGVSHMICE
jgi:hypothetical protein